MAAKVFTDSSGIWTLSIGEFFGREPDEEDGRKIVCWNLAPVRKAFPDERSVVLIVEHGGECDVLPCIPEMGAAGPYENITHIELNAVLSHFQ